MFPLHFHYEDVSRQDPLLKLNHANVMKVPRLFEIRLVPIRIQFGKLAMEIPRGQSKTQGGASFKAGATAGAVRPWTKSNRSIPPGLTIRSNRSEKHTGYVNKSIRTRQSALRGHGMCNFLVRISTVMSMLDSPVEIRENPIHFFMETEKKPELEDHFEIFEQQHPNAAYETDIVRLGGPGFNVTIMTSANTKDETLLPWSGLQDEGETK
nr:ribosomal protein L5 [Mayaca fluviatilis]